MMNYAIIELYIDSENNETFKYFSMYFQSHYFYCKQPLVHFKNNTIAKSTLPTLTQNNSNDYNILSSPKIDMRIFNELEK